MDNCREHEALPDPDWHHSSRLEAGLFLLALLIEAGIFFYLIWDQRIVGGHDGFQYFTFQYYFLNHVVRYGEIPLWIPFMTHGTIATWWHIIQSGILQNVFLLLGCCVKGINFLPLFYVAAFIDELLLLCGVWLLGRRYFASPVTIFFVALSIMGSCIWLLQPWWNFHFYYAIPLILWLGHMFLESGKWRYYLLAGNLLFIQSLGNLPYFLPVTSLVIFLYFLFYILCSHKETWPIIKKIDFGRRFVCCTSIIILLFIILYAAMNFGTEQLVNYNFRSPNGASSLDGFLTYGGKLNWPAWLELFSGISPALDYTLYTGIIFFPLILFGLIFNLKKKNIHFLLTTAVLLAFSMGTFVSIFFYYCWPMMKYFRHLALTTTIITVFLCFLAGFGFDALFFNKSRCHPLIIKIVLAGISIFMLGVALFLWMLSDKYPGNFKLFVDLIEITVPRYLSVHETLFNDDLIPLLLNRTALFALFFAVLLFSLLLNFYRFSRRRNFFSLMLILVLTLHLADIYGLKFFEIKFKTVALNDEIYKITEFQSMPYAKRRDVSFESKNSRAELLDFLPIKSDAFYWSNHALLFKDELGNPFNTCNWLLPLDNYMRAYWGQPVNDLSVEPLGLVYYSHLDFPKTHPAALKISGVTEDKIQFFSQAVIVPSEEIMASFMTDPAYNGDIIFLSPKKEAGTRAFNKSDFSEEALAADNRLRPPYQVQRFDSNNLVVTTDTNNSDSVWLLYSDIWHPFWRATVNGQAVPVYKANLAYKAVKLNKGENRVHFYFKSDWLSLFHVFIGLNALLWLGIILFLSGRLVWGGGMGPRMKKAT